jgi:NADPH:quinone reductase-like Zn-dependent oxidoreductase
MKSIVIGKGLGLDKLQLVNKESVGPDKGEIKVRWHASSLNYHDYLVAIGAIPVSEGRVPMSDGAGEIIEVGEDVNEWKSGDRVMSMFFPEWSSGKPEFKKIKSISGESVNGFLTEESCVPAFAVTRMPEAYTYPEAACLPCACLTAWNALVELGNIQNKQKLLIEGTGGMSVFALLLAQQYGLDIYATSGSESKFDKLKSLGVFNVVNYRNDENWGKSIFMLSGMGVDHIIDVGGGSTMKQSIEAACMGGSIYSIGILGNGRKGEITFPKLFFKFLKLQGLAVGSRAMQNRMVQFINDTGMKPIIDRSFSFDQIKEAFSYQASGKQFGKIVLEW